MNNPPFGFDSGLFRPSLRASLERGVKHCVETCPKASRLGMRVWVRAFTIAFGWLREKESEESISPDQDLPLGSSWVLTRENAVEPLLMILRQVYKRNARSISEFPLGLSIDNPSFRVDGTAVHYNREVVDVARIEHVVGSNLHATKAEV